jgi:DNA-binding CsgD family transcriptional regulator
MRCRRVLTRRDHACALLASSWVARDDRTTTLWAARPKSVSRPRVPALVALVEGLPQLVVLQSRELVVGRSPDCGLRVTLRGVSREHAKLCVGTSHGVSVVDLQSRNGTFVNGTRVDAVDLDEGDELHFGPLAAFRFTRAHESGATPGTAAPSLFDRLSARERDVTSLVADGLSNAAIAARLGIGRRTVATHLEHIFAKLGLGSRAELIRHALVGRR